jgi:hypothetical protein
MKVAAVPDLVELRTGSRPTVQTVYNWINIGVKGEKLKIVWGKRNAKSVFPDVRLTTQQWVDDFISKVGMKVGMS